MQTEDLLCPAVQVLGLGVPSPHRGPEAGSGHSSNFLASPRDLLAPRGSHLTSVLVVGRFLHHLWPGSALTMVGVKATHSLSPRKPGLDSPEAGMAIKSSMNASHQASGLALRRVTIRSNTIAAELQPLGPELGPSRMQVVVRSRSTRRFAPGQKHQMALMPQSESSTTLRL